MKLLFTVCFISSLLFGQILYEEHFTGGVMQLEWHPWVMDSMTVINDPTTPGGDDWAGSIANDSAPIAATYAGELSLDDYSIESWIYTIVSPGTSIGTYNGICVRMDTGVLSLYTLVSDFDNDARLLLRLIVGATPTVIREWSAGEIPGGVPGASSWHKFKLVMIADSIWAYYDDNLLPDCPFTDATVSQGYFGIYTFNVMASTSTRCDDIIVTAEPSGITEYNNPTRESFYAAPNPFRSVVHITWQDSSTGDMNIYDTSGRLIRQLNGSSGHTIWNGIDAAGNVVAPGVYFITDTSDNCITKVVKLK
jgi:hypothetical protein